MASYINVVSSDGTATTSATKLSIPVVDPSQTTVVKSDFVIRKELVAAGVTGSISVPCDLEVYGLSFILGATNTDSGSTLHLNLGSNQVSNTLILTGTKGIVISAPYLDSAGNGDSDRMAAKGSTMTMVSSGAACSGVAFIKCLTSGTN